MQYNKSETVPLVDSLLRKASSFQGDGWTDCLSVAEIREIVDLEENTLDIVWKIRYNKGTK